MVINSTDQQFNNSNFNYPFQICTRELFVCILPTLVRRGRVLTLVIEGFDKLWMQLYFQLDVFEQIRFFRWFRSFSVMYADYVNW